MRAIVTYSIDYEVAQQFNNMYSKGEKSGIINDLIKSYLKFNKSADTGDVEKEIEAMNRQESIIKAKRVELLRIKELQKEQQEQQELNEKRKLFEQERRNMPLIEDEFLKLLDVWDEDQKRRFTQEWKNHLEDNGYMINDCTKIQYWFRKYKSKNKSFI
jgi:DNA repair exonuclease SbcCD nuclease subunit